MKSFSPKPWTLPQPVLILGTYDKEGTPNAMNAAWGGTWDTNEVMISLGSHATTENLDLQGAFTLAFATVDTLVASDYVGIVSAKKEPNKIAKTGWNVVKSEHVNAPIFTNFPLTLECKVKETLNRDQSGYMLIGEIVNIVCQENFLSTDGLPDIEKMGIICYNPIHHEYIQLGKKVGQAFHDGEQLK
ncbi:MAG: flavin reductase [Bacteroidales bacterium]|nr:flavin reductase [Bacteroidales bacterium]